MATQTIQFSAATGLTLTAKLFAAGSDTVTDSQSATEGTNRKGVYTAAFTDVAAGTYQLIAFSGSTPVASWWVDLTLTTATFQSYEIATSTVQNGLATPADVTTALEDMELDKALIAQGAERAVNVDVNHRVHSHVYDMQANTVTASALAADAVAEIQSGLAQTGADGDTLETLSDQIDGIGGGGDATEAKQDDILAAILGSEVVQVASPNVQGNLVLTQGDDYDGTANPKAQWTVSVDYTDGWSVAFTIRDADDVVVYTTTGEVVSSTVVAVTIVTPTGLTMTGCPGQWQGKFDVELTKAGKKKTIALGTVYINEDQTR
jgi:hypothetical protein